MVFNYTTGEPVRAGDRVRTPEGVAVIVHLIEPGTEDAVKYQCPEGGILYRQVYDEYEGNEGLVLEVSPNNLDWDMVFLERGDPT